MQALIVLPFIALVAANPLQTASINPCKFSTPCFDPNEPCPCPQKSATATITPIVEPRAPKADPIVEPRAPKADPIVCSYKCSPCEEGQECPGLCDPLPLDPRCPNRCEEACKPCREGKICPFICLPVTLPADCSAVDPPTPGLEETIGARDAEKEQVCKFECPPCQPGEECPGLCDPAPLPPQCPNRCDLPGCKLCRPGQACPRICLPVTPPAYCPATYPPPPSPTLSARSAEDELTDCKRKCAADAAGICDPLLLPPHCPNRCDQGCKLCQGKICDIIKFSCLPITLPDDCAAAPEA